MNRPRGVAFALVLAAGYYRRSIPNITWPLALVFILLVGGCSASKNPPQTTGETVGAGIGGAVGALGGGALGAAAGVGEGLRCNLLFVVCSPIFGVMGGVAGLVGGGGLGADLGVRSARGIGSTSSAASTTPSSMGSGEPFNAGVSRDGVGTVGAPRTFSAAAVSLDRVATIDATDHWPSAELYVSVPAEERPHGIRRSWIVANFVTPTATGERSHVADVEVACSIGRSGMLTVKSVTAYSYHNGAGSVIAAVDLPVRPFVRPASFAPYEGQPLNDAVKAICK
jgi:hypothetical protein